MSPDEDKPQTDLDFGEGDGNGPESVGSVHVPLTGDSAGMTAPIGGRRGCQPDRREEEAQRTAAALTALEVEGIHGSDGSNAKSAPSRERLRTVALFRFLVRGNQRIISLFSKKGIILFLFIYLFDTK